MWCHYILATTRAIMFYLSYLPSIPLTPSAGSLWKFFILLYFFCVSPGEIMFSFLFPTQNKYNDKIATQKDCQWLPDQCWVCWASGTLALFWESFFVCLLGWVFLLWGVEVVCFVLFFILVLFVWVSFNSCTTLRWKILKSKQKSLMLPFSLIY